MTSTGTETDRVAALRDAESKAVALFDATVERGLVVPGKSERQLSDEVRDLAADLLGIKKFWHKRIVRSGINTLEPYRSNPPDLEITEDDVVFFDFGPLLEEWEADFGRTYVVGNDPGKHALAADLPVIWNAVHEYFHSHPDITGEELFAEVVGLVTDRGWTFGNRHAGHLIGEFPHEKVYDHEIECYVTPGSTLPMRRTDPTGKPCHWILEIHLIDPTCSFGGFHEQLLDI
jgi:Xaa-Pro dipeptidase